MGSQIECIKRIYKIQTPEGIRIEVESEERPISGVITAKLLQEDKEISSFFEKCKIVGIEEKKEDIANVQAKATKIKNIIKGKQKRKTKIKKSANAQEPAAEEKKEIKEEREIKDEREIKEREIKEIKEEREIKEIKEEREIKKVPPEEHQESLPLELAPHERINMMIKIGEEFTRPYYQKFIEDSGYRITDFMGFGDIEDALLLKRIEFTGEKIEKGLRKFRVIDATPIDINIYRETKRKFKHQIK